MGIILFITTINYGYKIRKDGALWSKTFLYSILVFLIIRSIAMLFQIGPAFILGEVPDELILFIAMLIPVVIYILGPSYIYDKKWLKFDREKPKK